MINHINHSSTVIILEGLLCCLLYFWNLTTSIKVKIRQRPAKAIIKKVTFSLIFNPVLRSPKYTLIAFYDMFPDLQRLNIGNIISPFLENSSSCWNK